MQKFFYALVALVAWGCAKGAPPQPEPAEYKLVIDSSFTTGEAQDIVAAAYDWGAVVDDITWEVVVVDRASIDMELEATPPKGTYYVIRTDTAASIPVECAVLEKFPSCYNAARIYLAEGDLSAVYDGFRKTTAHGLGHAWELLHSDFPSSIMQADLANMPAQPGQEDGLSYCLNVGCPVCRERGHCRYVAP